MAKIVVINHLTLDVPVRYWSTDASGTSSCRADWKAWKAWSNAAHPSREDQVLGGRIKYSAISSTSRSRDAGDRPPKSLRNARPSKARPGASLPGRRPSC